MNSSRVASMIRSRVAFTGSSGLHEVSWPTRTIILVHTFDVTTDRQQRQLELAATFFTAAVLLHNLDHLRRGADGLHGDVFLAGTLAMVLEVGVVAAVFARHRAAPLAAAVVGFSLAAGYVFVHFTPTRALLSDSLLSWSLPISIVAATLESVTALILGIVGLRVVHERGLAAMSGAGDETALDRDGLRHPVVIATAAGNAAIFVLTLLQYLS